MGSHVPPRSPPNRCISVELGNLKPETADSPKKNMREDNCPFPPKLSDESTTATKQRKKRKWDQPAESFISAGAGLSSTLQKINLQKIQDELIAREIVINDAESTIRYKLTKRQTQEEIQRCTGAVVITRGKYRPPNALPDTEKPLYLHISAGSHLKETAERIIAVDHAAAMVEEMLKQGQNPSSSSTSFHAATGGQFSSPLSTCVYLGFDTNPSLDTGSRIRGPNDQYVNHIMNETGATVVLRGQGSGNSDRGGGAELLQSLHLFLCAKNSKSLEDAKLLAENLLDTIAAECGVSRVSLSKVYKAVPPPLQLLAGVESSVLNPTVNSASAASMASSAAESTHVVQLSTAALPVVNGGYPHVAAVSQPGALLGYGHPQPNRSYLPTSLSGTSYSGYDGIYPQATPLQQVAQVLRQTPASGTSFTALATTSGNTLVNVNSSSSETERRRSQKRKFQEVPVASKLPEEPHQNSLQRSEFIKPGALVEGSRLRTTSSMPPPKKLVCPSSNGLPPPPPRDMPPPPSRTMLPPPSKLMSSISPTETSQGTSKPTNSSKLMSSISPAETSKPTNSSPDSIPDTLVRLMEYGDDDEDDEEEPEVVPQRSNSKPMAGSKPFWAP